MGCVGKSTRLTEFFRKWPRTIIGWRKRKNSIAGRSYIRFRYTTRPTNNETHTNVKCLLAKILFACVN